MNRIRLLIWVLSPLLTILPVGPIAAAEEATNRASASPSQVVTAFQETLLDVMKNAKALGVRGRYDKLNGRIKQTFHLGLMAQIASGSYWRKASKIETDKLVAAFSHLSISTYASQFDGYSGQSFKTQGEKPGPQNTTLIKTQIITPDSTPVDITYVTREIKGQWRVIDVLLDTGISELAVRRSEYRRILNTGGIGGLISTLNTKANQLLAE
ncbi:MAG: ABC transporter substrate-binding protein [Proteobacteria bacterium]|nr:ABC transporter substrate-binding protein [Pseudomonadota bacterium]